MKISALQRFAHNLREFVNYRHPDPRRVWKGGSELQLATSFPVDPVDPVDCADPLACSK